MATKIVTVVAGPAYSLALSDNGYLFGWGNLSFIGLDNITSTIPIQLGYNKYKMISGGSNHIMVIDINDILYGWGKNDMNQLGTFGTIDGDFKKELSEQSNLRWKSVSCGRMDTVAITLDGDMYTFGSNSFGQLGNNSTGALNMQYKINNSPWKKALCGINNKIALNEEGRLFVWGYGFYALLGNNTQQNIVNSLTEINNINGKWIDIITGGYTRFAINDKNEVYGWGYNAFGSLGNGSRNTINTSFIQMTPILITNLSGYNIRNINSNFETLHFMAIYNDNSLYTWGMNDIGQLGKGNIIKQYTPFKINTPSMINWVDAVGSETHSLAVDINGNVYTCGSNNMGQLGKGTIDTNIEHYTLEQIVIPTTIIPYVPPVDTAITPVDTAITPSDTTLLSSDTALLSSDTALPPSDTAITPSDTALLSSDTALLSSDTALPPVDTALPSSDTTLPPVDTALPPSDTALPPSDTALPPVDTALPSSDTTLPPSDTTLPPVDKTTPVIVDSSSDSNKKKTIIIVVSVISSVVFIILLLFLFYKLNIKYKWIKRLL